MWEEFPLHTTTKFMKKDEYKEFEALYVEWGEKYLQGEIGPRDFQQELLDYCRDNVNVLRLAWMKLWGMMHDLTNLHIGIENCKAASFTNLVWRTTIPWNKISLIPKSNYTRQNQQSKIALEWLIYQDLFYYAGEVEYAGKAAGEGYVRAGKKCFTVDGIHRESGHILEFLHCF